MDELKELLKKIKRFIDDHFLMGHVDETLKTRFERPQQNEWWA